jgi:RNA polymerase sigma-70 factor (ECF subfamily)
LAATDQALIERILAGDEGAFTELYHRHQPVLSRRLHRVLGRVEEVEDVVQVTFVELHRSLGRYRPELPFGPWLYGIGFRQAQNHLRRAKRRSWLSFQPLDKLPDVDLGASLEDQAERRELIVLLYQAMDKLPAKKRIAFSLHVLDGMGFTEIGELIKESPQTVRARVMSARKIVLGEFRRATKLAEGRALTAEQTG